MKRISLVLVLAVTVAAGAFGLRADAQSNDNAAIDALYQQFASAFRHKDLDAIMLPYVHNDTLFVFDVSTPREHVGWDDYRADWKGFFASIKGNPTFSISELSVLRKINGKWLIVQEHVSVPINFTTLKPDFMSRP
jgi:hypothetical protein